MSKRTQTNNTDPRSPKKHRVDYPLYDSADLSAAVTLRIPGWKWNGEICMRYASMLFIELGLSEAYCEGSEIGYYTSDAPIDRK